MAQQQADALALLAETALHHELDPGAPGERYQVVVHVDAPALADPEQPGQSVLEDGARVSAETSRRLACDASRVVMRHDADGRTRGGRRAHPDDSAGVAARAARSGTAAAASRAAGSRSARGITSATGRKGARPRSRTSLCSVAGTIARSTRRAIRSIDSPTARSSSGGRMAGCSPRSRPRPRCPPIRSRPSARGTTRRGCASTRGRRARRGWGSVWTWGGRSTCCIRSLRDARDHIYHTRKAQIRCASPMSGETATSYLCDASARPARFKRISSAIRSREWRTWPSARPGQGQSIFRLLAAGDADPLR